MTRKDRDRLKVLHAVRKGHITQGQAGKELGVSPRWVREVLALVNKVVFKRFMGRSRNEIGTWH